MGAGAGGEFLRFQDRILGAGPVLVEVLVHEPENVLHVFLEEGDLLAELFDFVMHHWKLSGFRQNASMKSGRIHATPFRSR